VTKRSVLETYRRPPFLRDFNTPGKRTDRRSPPRHTGPSRHQPSISTISSSTIGHVDRRATTSLRNLYIFRFGFSVTWISLVLALNPTTDNGTSPNLFLGALLSIYPLSDAIATIFDIRANSSPISQVPQWINLLAGAVAALAISGAIFSSLATAVTVFGVWAIISGAIQLFLGAHRRKTLRGQWLMIISGAGSTFAGLTFIGWTGTAAHGTAILAQYSAGGSVWYLLTALWLYLTSRTQPTLLGEASSILPRRP
jgi:uncharacterized membrane protein HdeD (DUF308 family)